MQKDQTPEAIAEGLRELADVLDRGFNQLCEDIAKLLEKHTKAKQP